MDSKFLYFLIGVAAGSVATFVVLRDDMNARIDAEVEEFRDTYSKAKMQQNASESVSEQSGEDVEENNEETAEKARKIAAENAQRKADLITSSNISANNGYLHEPVAYNLFSKPPRAIDIHNGQDEGEDLEIDLHPDEDAEIEIEPHADHPADKPYVITPEEFISERKDFDKTTLMYYTDGVLLEEISREIITDIDAAVGFDSLNRFGEFEEDVVYVRNERIGVDFEIIANSEPFSELYKDDT